MKGGTPNPFTTLRYTVYLIMWKVQGGGGDKDKDLWDPIVSRFRRHRSILDTRLYTVTQRMRPLSPFGGIIVCVIDVDAS